MVQLLECRLDDRGPFTAPRPAMGLPQPRTKKRRGLFSTQREFGQEIKITVNCAAAPHVSMREA